MAEGTGFENRRWGNPSKSSNLFPSAQSATWVDGVPPLAPLRDAAHGFFTGRARKAPPLVPRTVFPEARFYCR